MVSRILVPLDGSLLAEQAFACAGALARGLPAELILCRVIWIPPDILELLDESTVELNAIWTQLEGEAHDYLCALEEQLRDTGMETSSVVRQGPAAEAILDYAGQANVDQIVMATLVTAASSVGRTEAWLKGCYRQLVCRSCSSGPTSERWPAVGSSRRGATECWCHWTGLQRQSRSCQL